MEGRARTLSKGSDAVARDTQTGGTTIAVSPLGAASAGAIQFTLLLPEEILAFVTLAKSHKFKPGSSRPVNQAQRSDKSGGKMPVSDTMGLLTLRGRTQGLNPKENAVLESV